MDPKKRLLLLVGALFTAAVIYFAVDIMTRTTPPWQRNRAADSLARDSATVNSTTAAQPGNTPPAEAVTTFFSDAEVYEYRVRKNEVLGTIAEKFHFPLDSIRQLNSLTTDNIIENQKLRVRVRAMHRVGAGEVLGKIARRYGVPERAIMDANNITKPERQVQEGKLLAIPRPKKP
jgi:LysM repeat protein